MNRQPLGRRRLSTTTRVFALCVLALAAGTCLAIWTHDYRIPGIGLIVVSALTIVSIAGDMLGRISDQRSNNSDSHVTPQLSQEMVYALDASRLRQY